MQKIFNNVYDCYYLLCEIIFIIIIIIIFILLWPELPLALEALASITEIITTCPAFEIIFISYCYCHFLI